MSEHDLEDAGDEFQRLFGYAMELSLALTASDKLLREARGMMPEACACGDRGCNVMRDLEAEIDAHLEKANG